MSGTAFQAYGIYMLAICLCLIASLALHQNLLRIPNITIPAK